MKHCSGLLLHPPALNCDPRVGPIAVRSFRAGTSVDGGRGCKMALERMRRVEGGVLSLRVESWWSPGSSPVNSWAG